MTDPAEFSALLEYAETADIGSDPLVIDLVRAVLDLRSRLVEQTVARVEPPSAELAASLSHRVTPEMEERQTASRERIRERNARISANDAREEVDLDSLEKKARAATTGLWQAFATGARDGDHWYVVVDGESIAHLSANDGSDEDRREPNARHIAAASPDIVLALIERVRDAEVRPHGTEPHGYLLPRNHHSCGCRDGRPKP